MVEHGVARSPCELHLDSARIGLGLGGHWHHNARRGSDIHGVWRYDYAWPGLFDLAPNAVKCTKGPPAYNYSIAS
jgi:hypothetical protein